MNDYACQYCGKSCKTGSGLSSHERHCDDNPSDTEKFECPDCGSLFSKKSALDPHRKYCDENPNSLIKEFPYVCDSSKCDKVFTVKKIYYKFKKKENHFCSNSCARSFATQESREEINSKVSDTLEGRSTMREAGYSEDEIADLVRESTREVREERKIQAQKKKDWEAFECPVCGDKYIIEKGSRQYCSRECYQKSGEIGGWYKGVGTGNRGRYKDDWYDSSWELAFAVYHYDHHIPFKRVMSEKFPYEVDDEMKHYIPDFKYHDDHYIEVKGWEREYDHLKWESFPHRLDVLREDEMLSILDYVISKYGKNFWERMYE